METDEPIQRNLSIINVSPELERCLQKKKPQKRNQKDEGMTEMQYSAERKKKKKTQQQILRDTRKAAMEEIESRIPILQEAMKERGKSMQENEKISLFATHVRRETFAKVAEEVFPNLLIPFPTAKWDSEPEGNEIYMAVSHAGHFTRVTKKLEKFLGIIKMYDLFANYLTLFDLTHPGETNKLMEILKPDKNKDGFPSVSNATTKNFEMQRRACQFNLVQVLLDGDNFQIRYNTFLLNAYLIVPKVYYAPKQDDENHQKREAEQKLFLACVLTPWKDYKLNFPELPESGQYPSLHSKDGRIIDTGHSITSITNHLFEEVRGKTAFSFMHKDDVRWVLIATRHMYMSTEGNGSSCYRLETKCGRFIHLRTVGYLNADPNSETFLCINTVLSEDEGKKAIKALRDRFSVYINTEEPGFNTLVEDIAENDNDIDSSSTGKTEEPAKLQELLTAMLLNLKLTPATSSVEMDPISSGSSTLQPSASCVVSTSSTKDNEFSAPPGSTIDEFEGIWEMNLKSTPDATSSVERDPVSSGLSNTLQPSACVASTSSVKDDEFSAPPGSTNDEFEGIWEIINEQIPQLVKCFSSDECNASNSLLSL